MAAHAHQSNESFLPLFLRTVGAELPCPQSQCFFCPQLQSLNVTSLPLHREIRILHNAESFTSCPNARRVSLALKGSIVFVSGFCFYCQIDSGFSKNFEMFDILPTQGEVDIDDFMLPTNEAEPVCKKHNKGTYSFVCFGDVPQICFIRSRHPINRETASCSEAIQPLQFCRTGRQVQLMFNGEKTFLGKSLFVVNPCYASSWIPKKVHVLGHWREEDLHYCLIRTGDTGYDLNRWDLQEVYHSKPFAAPTGLYKIMDSMSSQSGPLDYVQVAVYPPLYQKSSVQESISLPVRQQSSVEHETETVLEATSQTRTNGTTLTENTADTVQITATPEISISNQTFENAGYSSDRSTRETTSQSSIQDDLSIAGVPEELTDTPGQYSLNHVPMDHDVLHHSRTTSIPFLYASYPFLWASQFCNDHYLQDSATAGKSLEECTSKLRETDETLFVSGISSSDFLRVDTSLDAKLSTTSRSLSLQIACDLDSLDFITIPWGGMSFRGNIFTLFCTYKPSFVQPSRYLAVNNNFSAFHHGVGEYPGKYFLDRSFSRLGVTWNEEVKDEDPLALVILEMKSALCMRDLKIRAIIPSGCIVRATIGTRCLVNVFIEFVSKQSGKAVPKGLRQGTSIFFWFLIKELLLSLLSFVSRDVRYPSHISTLMCCSFSGVTRGSCCAQERDIYTALGLDNITLDGHEMILAFCLAARFFAALEVHSELPASLRTFTQDNEHLYECQEDILSYVQDPDVKRCLECNVSDEFCLQFFSEKLWNCGTLANGLVHLNTDPSRRAENALPSEESSLSAYESGYMCLEDLLILAPILFRCTEHGLKRAYRNSQKGAQFKAILEKEISLGPIADGIVDIACTLEGPPNSGWAVLLPEVTARKSRLLVPTSLSPRTFRQLQASLYTTQGYPNFIGFSTRKGHVGDSSSVLTQEGVRRVKCYSANRKNYSIGGKTVYTVSGKQLKESFRHASNLVCEWTNLKQDTPAETRKKCRESESKRTKSFETIFHDLERRTLSVTSDQEQFGLRLEMTFACNKNWDFIEETIHLLRIQEKRRSMSEEEFERHFAANPEKWPWFTKIPCEDHPRERNNVSFELNGSLIPVTLIPCKPLLDFHNQLELSLLRSSQQIYLQSRKLVASRAVPSLNSENKFIQPFLQELPQGIAVQFSIIISRALLHGAEMLLEAQTCHFKDLSFQMPSFVMSACGVNTSYFVFGIPQLICSRALSLERCYERALYFISTQNKVIQDLKGTEDMESVSIELDERLQIPFNLTLAFQRARPGFRVHVLGTHFDYDFVVASSPNDSRPETILSVIMSMFKSHFGRGFEPSFENIAAFIVALLVSDVCRELERMLGQNLSQQANKDALKLHRTRQDPRLNTQFPEILAAKAKNAEMWPNCFRIDICSAFDPDPPHTEIQQRINGLVSFYRSETSTLYCALGEEGRDIRNLLTQEDGSVLLTDFLQKLWELGGLLPHFSELLSIEANSTESSRHSPNWRSIIALRIIEDLVNKEDERLVQTFPRESRMGLSSLKQFFVQNFSGLLGNCLKSAGFLNLCPLLMECLPRGNTISLKVWGPMPVFTRLVNDHNMPRFVRDDVERGFGGVYYNRMRHRQQRLASCLRYLSSYKKEFQSLNDQLHAARSSNNNINNLLKKKRDLGSRMWRGGPFLNTLLAEHMAHLRESLRESISLNKESYDFCIRLLDFLISLRRKLIDEGIGAFSWKPSSSNSNVVRSVRDLEEKNRRQTRAARHSFACDTDCFKKPWGKVGYPNAGKTRDGKITKKIRVRDCSQFLFETNLVWKLVASTHRKKGQFNILNWRKKGVHYLFERYKGASRAACVSSHAMWRLRPDEDLLETLESYCKHETELFESS